MQCFDSVRVARTCTEVAALTATTLAFLADVDALLPGRYARFPTDAWHITLRAL